MNNLFNSVIFFKKVWFLLVAGWILSFHVAAKKEHLLPIPQQITVAKGQLHWSKKQVLTIAGIASHPAMCRFFEEFGISQVQFVPKAICGDVVVQWVDSIPCSYDYQLLGYPSEAYQLQVETKGVTIKAVNEMGLVRAMQTLTQLAEGWSQPGITLERVTITDWPAFKLRGFMHDIGRSYLSVETLKRHIDRLARFKVNTFHWHFTENQGFRFEVKAFPQLNESQFMTRDVGKYYTQAECREIEHYALSRGVYIIPEIDMPGHSAAFRRAMGYDMQSEAGKVALKQILTEVSATFKHAPYIHIGADEEQTTAAYVNEMAAYVQDTLQRRCAVWNPMLGVAGKEVHADLFQLWSTAGKAVEGKPNIDCRYNYTNHFDVFADLVGIYKSTIYYRKQGDATVAGTISGMWNDRRVENEEAMVVQNNFYAHVIASMCRAWQGGGEQYIDKEPRGTHLGGGVMLPNEGKEYDDFIQWETRFLFHKDHCLKTEPIPYVQQSQVRWRITEAFDNGGDTAKIFPPEILKDQAFSLPLTFDYDGKTYTTGTATGAGIYLRHTWGERIVNAYYSAPRYNQTAYAWTYVYAPRKQTVGALVELQNYSRSELDPVPEKGTWDLMGSKIWINNQLLPAPDYQNRGVRLSDKEVTLKNENFTARRPIPVTLSKGWNRVLLKLPYVNAPYRLDKWMFTFVFTDLEGKQAAEGLIYRTQLPQ